MTQTPQPGIFALGTRAHLHLEFTLLDSPSLDELYDALAALREPNVAGGAANIVIGFGPDLWPRLCSNPPADLGPFREVAGRDGQVAPATQNDIWVWIHGTGRDEVYDRGSAVTETLAAVARVVDDASAFVYHDSRDLTGFIDGTANPNPSEAPGEACVPAGRPGVGGSHVIVQRWVHDLEKFHALDELEQEKVFGRTKLDSVKLPDDVRPPDAHIELAEIHDADGEELEIYRRSVPWGSVTEKGLVFVGFSPERDRFDRMLAQMYGTDGRELQDRLLSYTTAVSGAYYFAPSLEELLAVGVAAGDDEG